MQSLYVVQQSPETPTCRCSDEEQKFLVCNCVQHKNCPTLHCDLCNYNTDIGNILRHFQSVKHSDRHKKLMQDLYLTHLPPPTAAHYKRMSTSVTNMVKRSELTKEDLVIRQLSLQRFNEILQRIEPNCTIRVYGSTINGFGLKQSNVNIELARQGEETAESSGQLLRRISEVISQFQRFDFQYVEIFNDFDIKVPRLNFVELTKDRHHTRRLKFELSVTAEKSWKSSNLFHFYATFDERARILGIALRLWARAFKLDNQENGTWPPIAFVVLVIHYLQRTEPPVLPCFHELQDKTSPKSTESKEVKENSEEETPHELADADIAALKHTWEVKNKKSVGELWIGLFRYYIYDFQCGTNVVSIRKTTRFDTHGNKGWGTKILAIEDPTRPSCNLSRSVGNIKIYHFFTEVWRDTYKYLMTPHSSSGPFFSQKDFALHVRPVLSRLQLLSLRLEKMNALKDAAKSDDNSEENDHESSDEDSNTQANCAYGWRDSKKLIAEYGLYLKLNPDIEKRILTFGEDNFYYSLEFERLGFYRMPPRFCRLCRKQGHSQSHCPLERKVELVEIPEPMPENHKCILNHIIDLLFNESRLKPEDEKKHAAVLLSLAVFIRKSQFFEDSNLELFGSTKNGFGAWDCDLDICLTFKSNITGEGIDQADIIIKLFELLSKHPDVQNLIPITQAKVPILKFDFVLRYQDTSQKYECDISLYNRLALYNTKLLRTYCEIDERVRKLGFIVKYFAKTCEIGDASRGSLSSYAYTLMTLHYLQQCNPPVIPVLQEMYEGMKPECMIDGWNTWFYEDYQNIPNIWKHFRTNNLSVAELFVGFLKYYSQTFDFGKHVVCINQLQSLCKLKKMWTGKRIAIEDPFLLTHNLGQGVDDHMAVFIKTAICKGRNVIGRPPDELPHRCPSWKLYFFDKDRLTVGNLPTGRGCRHCGKIGHKMSECPIFLEKKANRTLIRKNRNQTMNEGGNVLNLQTQRNERYHEVHEQQRVRNTHNYNHHPHEYNQQHQFGYNQRQRSENQNHQHTNDMPRNRRHPNAGNKPSGLLRKPRHHNDQ